ncbi:hypothetical protein DFH27DRAFT_613376 [Peziza echinospora]|nr:hypothetical protein DFH27DRAFT_613376 [Peziza echinospora]
MDEGELSGGMTAKIEIEQPHLDMSDESGQAKRDAQSAMKTAGKKQTMGRDVIRGDALVSTQTCQAQGNNSLPALKTPSKRKLCSNYIQPWLITPSPRYNTSLALKHQVIHNNSVINVRNTCRRRRRPSLQREKSQYQLAWPPTCGVSRLYNNQTPREHRSFRAQALKPCVGDKMMTEPKIAVVGGCRPDAELSDEIEQQETGGIVGVQTHKAATVHYVPVPYPPPTPLHLSPALLPHITPTRLAAVLRSLPDTHSLRIPGIPYADFRRWWAGDDVSTQDECEGAEVARVRRAVQFLPGGGAVMTRSQWTGTKSGCCSRGGGGCGWWRASAMGSEPGRMKVRRVGRVNPGARRGVETRGMGRGQGGVKRGCLGHGGEEYEIYSNNNLLRYS